MFTRIIFESIKTRFDWLFCFLFRGTSEVENRCLMMDAQNAEMIFHFAIWLTVNSAQNEVQNPFFFFEDKCF